VCGVVGSVNRAFDEETLELIKHRGPDDSDIVNLTIGKNKLTLGHRRLSIQDLSLAGRQPMYSVSKKFIIIFNGEIYNHLELKKRLSDIEFIGHSDTETIVNYIEKFGIDSIGDFNGIFGLCVVDIENKKLYLARDRFGVKPLYYSTKGGFVFSSEVKPILKIIDSYKIDSSTLNSYLTLRYTPARETMIEGVSKLKSGEILEYDIASSKITISNINDNLIRNIKIDKNRSEKYWVDKLSDKFHEAVNRQMLSDVEVGSFLSGGVDSALITAVASKYSKNKIKTFCIGFEGADIKDDEILEAKRSSELLGTEHYDIIVNPKDYMRDLEKSMFINEEPNGTDTTLAQYEISRLGSKYVKVILAGQGADEIFMGYGRYGAEIKRKRFLPLIKLAKQFDFLFKHPKFHRVNRALYSLTEKNEYRRFEKIYSVFNEKERKKLLGNLYRDESTGLKSLYNQIPTDILSSDKMSIMDTYGWLSDELLLYGDKTTMATSVEMRVPFLDNKFVQTVQQIPSKFKTMNGKNKYILRKMAEKILPTEIINRPKKGFAIPTLKWFQEDLNEDIMNLLNSDDSLITQYINRAEIESLILNYRAKRENDERKIFLLMNIEYLLRLLNKKFIL